MIYSNCIAFQVRVTVTHIIITIVFYIVHSHKMQINGHETMLQCSTILTDRMINGRKSYCPFHYDINSTTTATSSRRSFMCVFFYVNRRGVVNAIYEYYKLWPPQALPTASPAYHNPCLPQAMNTKTPYYHKLWLS